MMMDKCAIFHSLIGLAILAVEAWLGRTSRVKSNSLLELIWHGCTIVGVAIFVVSLAIKTKWREKKNGS